MLVRIAFIQKYNSKDSLKTYHFKIIFSKTQKQLKQQQRLQVCIRNEIWTIILLLSVSALYFKSISWKIHQFDLAMPKCEKKYNGYYSYGDCGSQNGVSSFEECCELTKQRQLDQPNRDIIRFSWNGNS